MTGQENKSKMGPIECSGGSENRVLSPAEGQEVGHTISDWDSGNTGSLVITLCGLLALRERKVLLHLFPKEIRSSEGK